jgi:hypothetical protein
MRPDFVEVDGPTIALALLGAAAPGRNDLQFGQIPVHPLVGAVVLRFTWSGANELNA